MNVARGERPTSCDDILSVLTTRISGVAFWEVFCEEITFYIYIISLFYVYINFVVYKYIYKIKKKSVGKKLLIDFTFLFMYNFLFLFLYLDTISESLLRRHHQPLPVSSLHANP